MSRKLLASALAVLAAGAIVASAGLVVDTTGYSSIDRANFQLANTGQTFTTGDLGAETFLSTIVLLEARDYPGTVPSTGDAITLELWTDTDQNHATWDPGALLGTSLNSVVFENPLQENAFSFSGVALANETVYTVLISSDDASGDNFIRFAVSRNANEASGTYKEGTLFNDGVAPFSDTWDTAFAVQTAIPEPATTLLLFVGAAVLGVRRRYARR